MAIEQLTADPATAGAPPATAGAPPAEAAGAEVLNLSFVQEVLKGQPPGYVFTKGLNTPSISALKDNFRAVVDAGLNFFKPTDKKLDAVMFNPAIFPEEAMVKADKAGILQDLFPPFLPENDPILAAELGAGGEAPGEPGAEGGAPMAAPMQAASPMGGPPASVQGQTAKLRADQMAPKAPSQRAKPGAGGVLNSLIQRTV